MYLFTEYALQTGNWRHIPVFLCCSQNDAKLSSSFKDCLNLDKFFKNRNAMVTSCDHKHCNALAVKSECYCLYSLSYDSRNKGRMVFTKGSLL